MSQHEPAQLWSVYASEQDGVAIKTSYSRLSKSLKGSDKTIRCGKISYLNYEKDKISLTDNFAPVFTKRVEFEHEEEMRLCISDMTTNVEKTDESGNVISTEVDFLRKEQIIPQSCNIDTLIEEVRVAPFSKQWSTNAIEDVTRKFELHFPIRKSCLVE